MSSPGPAQAPEKARAGPTPTAGAAPGVGSAGRAEEAGAQVPARAPACHSFPGDTRAGQRGPGMSCDGKYGFQTLFCFLVLQRGLLNVQASVTHGIHPICTEMASVQKTKRNRAGQRLRECSTQCLEFTLDLTLLLIINNN